MAVDLNSDEVRTWKIYLRAQAHAIRVMERDFEVAVGIPLTWYDMLTQLSLAEGKRMTHKRLGQRILIMGGGITSVSGITRAVDRMEKAGYVRREASTEDRRASFVVITPKGERMVQEGLDDMTGIVDELFLRHLQPGDTTVMRRFFARMLGEDEPK